MVQMHSHDKYKRILGDVILPDDMNLNQELVKQGWGPFLTTDGSAACRCSQGDYSAESVARGIGTPDVPGSRRRRVRDLRNVLREHSDGGAGWEGLTGCSHT